MSYEQITKINRVRIIYRRGVCIAEGAESKVYRVSTRHYPSGEKYVLLVWSADLGRCVWVREDDVEVVSVAEA